MSKRIHFAANFYNRPTSTHTIIYALKQALVCHHEDGAGK